MYNPSVVPTEKIRDNVNNIFKEYGIFTGKCNDGSTDEIGCINILQQVQFATGRNFSENVEKKFINALLNRTYKPGEFTQFALGPAGA